MMPDLKQYVDIGILGLIALTFIAMAGILFKRHLKMVDSTIKSQNDLTKVMANHFKADQEFMTKINDSITKTCILLDNILEKLKELKG